MIEYNLMDINGNIFELNGSSVSLIERKTLGFDGESFAFENKIIENSFLPGGIKIGESRLKTRTLNFYFTIAKTNDSDFNTHINNILFNLNKVAFLIDVTNSKRISVNLRSINVPHDIGMEKRLSEIDFSLECLNPFWEDYNLQEINDTISAGVLKTIIFINDSYMDIYPIINLTAQTACSYIDIQNNLQFIRVENSYFGTTNYKNISINNEEGFIALGITDITKDIKDGLGFIYCPVGQTLLNFKTPVACDLNIQYRRRYYL